MKMIYLAPTSQAFEIRTNGMLALSLQNGTGDAVTNNNQSDYEQLTQKKNAIWGDDSYSSDPWKKTNH